MNRISKVSVAVSLLLGLTQSANVLAADDGSQMHEKFRVNFAGYMPQASKTGLYLSNNQGVINWSLVGTDCSGTEDTYVNNDKSSGDSFYIIDFSECVEEQSNVRLSVGGDRSVPFNIAKDPYGKMKFEFFDYFKDHEAWANFQNARNNWAHGLNIAFSYVKDAGDNGAYPVNTAEASWALINMLETYPDINEYYSSNMSGAKTVYEQIKVLTEQFYHVFDHGGKLAIPKFHTNVQAGWADCSPHSGGTCISEPETKATFSTARTLAALARLHDDYGTSSEANDAYERAKTALFNAQNEPFVCNQANSFGGEGGMYPDNDITTLWRDPKSNRDNCVAHHDNTDDDEYTAIVEVYIAAVKLGKSDASAMKSKVMSHSRFNEASSYWWGAVVMEGNLSLLTHEDLHDIDLSTFKTNLMAKADKIVANSDKGYPGVTWDPYSNQWNSGDQDHIDNNVRWGSHRMALNDARILMAAAEVNKKAFANAQAAHYARSAVKILDHIAGINAVNLAMFTASGYPEYEHAITRTHDAANGGDSWPGKMVLGPNNWTNANDGAMPRFGSLPGLKMFALTGGGWASREVSIDANASLVPVAYFATEVAPSLFDLSPIGGAPEATKPPAAPSMLTANATGHSSVTLTWQDNAGNNEDFEAGYQVYQNTVNNQPNTPSFTTGPNETQFTAKNLTEETRYFFWVEAFNNLGTSTTVSGNATTLVKPAFENMLTNGDFTGGSAGWSCEQPSGAATCSVNAGVYNINISDGGSAEWHVQPLQGGLSLTAGSTYTFAFDAKASSSRSAQIKIERDGTPWEDFSEIGSGQNLTTSMQRFSYTFTMNDSLNNARVVMNLGGDDNNVSIDNIWLVEDSVDPCNGRVGCTPEEPSQFDITVNAGANGSISPNSVAVKKGQSQTFSIKPDAGYLILDVVKNGKSLGPVNSVTFTNVTADGSLTATFREETLLQDKDLDGVADMLDNCPNHYNPKQWDKDGDGIGNKCDSSNGSDRDNDGVLDGVDNCPNHYNPKQWDKDGDGIGNKCDSSNGSDRDNDGVLDNVDNCPNHYNPKQFDKDKDGIGNKCDTGSQPPLDIDNDGVVDSLDNCPTVYNPNQYDRDKDGIGNRCD